MYTIKVLGAGQLGSRHLQALKQVGEALDIEVVDPSQASLKVAQERYELLGVDEHLNKICYSPHITSAPKVDIAIVATNSNVRRQAIESLLSSCEVDTLILEKILFHQAADYEAIQRVLEEKKIKAFVNCSMRAMPCYQSLKPLFANQKISYRVTGGQFGLVTNAIHYLDHVADITGCLDYIIDTTGLEANPIASKRAGFLEFNGTLTAHFAEGSRADISCYAHGDAPVIVEIFSEKARCLVRESEGKVWQATDQGQWQWQEQDIRIPYQSEMTTALVQGLLKTGECPLVPYAESVQIHKHLLEPLSALVKDPEVNYPFT